MVFKFVQNLDHHIDHNFLEAKLLSIFDPELVAINGLKYDVNHFISLAMLKLLNYLIDHLYFAHISGLV